MSRRPHVLRVRPNERARPLHFLVLTAFVVLTAVLAGCGVFGDDTDASQRTTGPYAVGTRSLALVDESRPTPAFKDQPEQPSRTVTTDVWYPAAGEPGGAATTDADPAEGPFPLVVFNHGQQGEPQQYAVTLEAWARAGYVVAAPRHPLTIRHGPGALFVQDSTGEVGDIPFVIDRVEDELADLVDTDHVAVVGHSSGAIAALAVGFNSCCRDDRVDAVVLESAIPFSFEGGTWFGDIPETPVLFFHGDADNNQIANGRKLFGEAPAPKAFVTVEGGDHSGTYRTGERAALVGEITTHFLDRYLKEREGSWEELEATVREHADLAALEADPG